MTAMTQLLQRLAKSRFRISAQLYAGLAGAVSVTLVASLVAWFSFDRVGDAQERVNRHSVPELAASFGIAQRSGALVAAAPRLIGAVTAADLQRVRESVTAERAAFQAHLSALLARGSDRNEGVSQRGSELIANIDAIDASMAERFALAARSEALRSELSVVRDELAGALVPAIDDQWFFTMTGYRSLDASAAPRAEHLSEGEFDRYRLLAGLQADASLGIQILASAFNLSDAPLLEPLRDRFEATAQSIGRRLAGLADTPARAAVDDAFERLGGLGLGADGGFALRARELALAGRQQALLAENRSLAMALLIEVEGLVSDAEGSAGRATQASADAIATGRSLLLAVNTFSIVGAALVAWLFVGRVLLRRIDRLSRRMRAMADGDLEAEVDISGRDEVADMAAALEVFRRHALEVQRLNLVEKLADELKSKNGQLEDAMEELRQAQDQIVAREKLAGLGELTAGVAHEIKNPLNFVKNFAEASQELLEELNEVVAEVGDAFDEEQRGIVDEVCQDLTDNLGRIRGHGERADRIVQDMLKMGRDAADRQLTDINGLLDQNVRLAFHAVRASDSDFMLDIKQELDEGMGEVEVVPQDVGRVFLNMVTNACHAVDERRKAEVAAGNNDFVPTLTVATKRLDDHVEVRIRDNGSGIPEDVIGKIFNPFFTTKPTDQGTGLGLALSSDIVREHGGEIRVESEVGSFTEMIIDLPVTAASPPADVAGAATDEAAAS